MVVGMVLTLTSCARQEPSGARSIPVLVFHEICATTCGPNDLYGTTQVELVRTMRAIKDAGYETVSMSDFVRAHDGDFTGLPARPILVTFDDGRQDAYRGADPVMRELGLRATMFVITDVMDGKHAYAMQWPDVTAAAASGRWDIQLHAHAGHVQIPVGIDPSGVKKLGAFYGWRRCEPAATCETLEPFTSWKQRTEDDIVAGDTILRAKLGAAYEPLSFAVPYSDYGQVHSNDPAIAPELRAFLDARFPVWFTQPGADPKFMMPKERHEVPRYVIRNTTTAEAVSAWIAKHEAPPPFGDRP